MKRMLFLSVLLVLPATATARPVAEAPAAVRSLVGAEMGFNQASADSGMRAAFLAHLSGESVIFRPFPVNGPEWMESWPGTQGILSWTPEHAEVSRGGDFGFTTGPWEYFGSREQENPTQTGYYLSVWQRGDDGWRVLGDIGTVGPIPDSLTVGDITWTTPAGEAPQVSDDFDATAARDELMEEDAALSGAVFESGLDRFIDRTTEDVLMLRLQQPLMKGREAARESAGELLVYPTWEPEGGAVAASGDLGFTYGRIYPSERALGKATEATGSYLRVWRRRAGGPWLVAAEVLIPKSRG